MKKIYAIIGALLLTVGAWAQSPELISYQAVVRDADADLIVEQTVGIQISILEGSLVGSPVYEETHFPLSNVNGLVSIEIGAGNVVSGDFAAINWADGSYFIKTETDPDGGTNFTITGTSQLLSVPYALHANTADILVDGIVITEGDTAAWNAHFSGEYDDLNNAPENVSVFINDAGYLTAVNESDTSATNELQVLSISNDTLFLSDGGFVMLPFGPSEAQTNDLISFDGENWVAKNAVIHTAGGQQAQNNMQPYLAVYHIIAIYGTYPSRSSSDPFIAEIIMFAGNFAPRNWAFCDGQLLPISQNTALFSLVGTTYGGDGRTTFGLPDLRGRTAIHPGTGPGLSFRRHGEKGGTEVNYMNATQMPAHSHVITYQ